MNLNLGENSEILVVFLSTLPHAWPHQNSHSNLLDHLIDGSQEHEAQNSLVHLYSSDSSLQGYSKGEEGCISPLSRGGSAHSLG
mmetsp:Transcript_8386/g.10898  ORF Transcript_8386/g.10898 Transcript_8386/m.10898 type:complete len:84 (+) Transcript_8386:29-280(+)